MALRGSLSRFEGTRPMKSRLLAVFILLLVSAVSWADDRSTLTELLHDFLAHSAERQAHERFWSEELVYTSSSGSRTSKPEILAGFDGDAEDDGTKYAGEEVDIRLYGDMAVIAFKLTATQAGASAPSQYYFNTGTFRKQDGRWQAVAWQATIIPGSD